MAKQQARRSQHERSQEMRKRLIDATLQCLEQDGYAGTTISRIIEVAGVSRGAPVHHFPSKNALIAAAAEQLIKRVYAQLGEAVNHLEQSEDRLTDLILVSWHRVFERPENKAMMELLLASSRDEELATIMRRLWSAGFATVGVAAEHYLQARTPNDDVRKWVILTQWLLRGMAQDRYLIDNPQLYDHYLTMWSKVMAQHLSARPDVNEAPPRPAFWDVSVLASDQDQ